jgi:hypothetical protein
MKLNKNEQVFWDTSFNTALSDCFEVRKDEFGRMFCVRLAADVADAAVIERRRRIDESTEGDRS